MQPEETNQEDKSTQDQTPTPEGLKDVTNQTEEEQQELVALHLPEALIPKKEGHYWQRRKKHGREPDYTPDALYDKALEYFQWVDENPLYMAELMKSGELAGHIAQVPKRRPYTLTGFQLFAEISHVTFLAYEKRKEPEYLTVCRWIRETVYNQKFEGAAAGFFNHAIIARDLGLVDRADIKSGDKPLAGIPLISFVDPSKQNKSQDEEETDGSDSQA